MKEYTILNFTSQKMQNFGILKKLASWPPSPHAARVRVKTLQN
jgi:hypothetical protein